MVVWALCRDVTDAKEAFVDFLSALVSTVKTGPRHEPTIPAGLGAFWDCLQEWLRVSTRITTPNSPNDVTFATHVGVASSSVICLCAISGSNVSRPI